MTKQTEDFIKLYHLRRSDKIQHACENCTYCTGYEFKIGKVDTKCNNPIVKCISNKIDKTWVCDLFIERKSKNENTKSKK